MTVKIQNDCVFALPMCSISYDSIILNLTAYNYDFFMFFTA